MKPHLKFKNLPLLPTARPQLAKTLVRTHGKHTPTTCPESSERIVNILWTYPEHALNTTFSETLQQRFRTCQFLEIPGASCIFGANAAKCWWMMPQDWFWNHFSVMSGLFDIFEVCLGVKQSVFFSILSICVFFFISVFSAHVSQSFPKPHTWACSSFLEHFLLYRVEHQEVLWCSDTCLFSP